MIETKLVKFQALTFLAVKTVKKAETVFCLYEPTQDTDSKALHRSFDDVKGTWKRFIMSLSWSKSDGAMHAALEMLNTDTKFRKRVSSGDKVMQAVVKSLTEATEADVSIQWASKKYFSSVEDYTRNILVQAYPEAQRAVANGSIWFRLPRNGM